MTVRSAVPSATEMTTRTVPGPARSRNPWTTAFVTASETASRMSAMLFRPSPQLVEVAIEARDRGERLDVTCLYDQGNRQAFLSESE